jgi:diguanylate cyclase (GGDEF)-like protein
MPADTEAAARLRAYELMQVVQSAARESAVRDLVALEAHARLRGWREAELVAAAGLTMSILVRPDGDQEAAATDSLLARARSHGAPHLLALALALRAVAAAGRDDGEALLADAASALAIVEEESLPALDRCAVLLICAAGYNTLRLWELVTDLLDRASALAPLCESPVQEPAVAANRAVVRLEWAVSLLETGATQDAWEQLELAEDAATRGLGTDGLQPMWRHDLLACADLSRFVLASRMSTRSSGDVADELAVLDAHAETLAADGDVEVLPTLQALVPYALLRRGRPAEALARVRRDVRASTTSGAASFPLWVRAEVMAAQDRSAGAADLVSAFRDHADAVSRHRWTMRQGMLEAARGRIASASVSIENLALARDVMLDPLTGISNRRAFDAWRTAVHPVETAAALMLLDLDRFKQINDLHGHAVGDDVLRAVSRLLVAHVRPGDLALRLGGDELAVVVQHPPTDATTSRSLDLDALAATADERAAALSEAVAATDWDQVAPDLRVRISVGVAVGFLGPHDSGAADRLYRAADADLYAAKARRTRSAG